MTTTHDLVTALKDELRAAHVTYADLADHLGLSQSSIKRMFALDGDMPLSRIDDILRVLKLDFADLASKVAEARPLRQALSAEQERAVVADRKLLLVAICCLSRWTLEQIVASCRLDAPEAARLLAELDRLGLVELRPLNRYRLKVAKTFRWRPHGPVMEYFRTQVAGDYFGGGFEGVGETLMLVHGHISPAAAASLVERLQSVGEDFAQQHLADQRLAADRKAAYTLVVGMRSWLFAGFRELMRDDAGGGSA